MSINNENLRNVAQAALDIMTEKKLHPNQQKLDVHEPEKDELTADDFKKLRVMKKEETEQVDEAMQKSDVPAYLRKQQGDKPLTVADVKGPRKDSISAKENLAKARNEEVEQVEEAEKVATPTGMKVYGSSYGNSQKARREQIRKSIDTAKGPKASELTGKKKFTEMVSTYLDSGIKGLFESLIKEEPDNETFTKEVEENKKKAEGKAKQADVAKAAVKAVQSEEVEQLDELSAGTLKSYVNKAKPEMKSAQAERQSARETGDYKTAGTAGDVVNKRREGIKTAKAKLNAEEVEQIEEKEMTDAQMKKREEIVKSMKKGMAGFKERYGERAKNVMYATATKQAMKD